MSWVTGLPWASRLTRMSSSVIADAIQSAPRWATRPLSAVTSPPPPRCTVRSPTSSRWNSAGPRLETITRRRSGLTRASRCPSQLELPEQLEPVAQEPRRQEHLARVLLAGPPQAFRQLGVAQNAEGPLRGLLGRGDQESRLSVLDLKRDAANVPGDHGAHLPHRLGDGQAEPLAQRLLHDHIGLGLEGVHLDRAHVVEVVEDLDVGI